MNRTRAAAAPPSVIGGPGSVFMTTVLLATELSPVRSLLRRSLEFKVEWKPELQ